MEENRQYMSAEEAVKAYLDRRAQEDPLFAASYAKPTKSVGECIAYIKSEARKLGAEVMATDEWVWDKAVHYYDEDDIKFTPALGRMTRQAAPAVQNAKPQSATETQNHARRPKSTPLAKDCRKMKQLSIFDILGDESEE